MDTTTRKTETLRSLCNRELMSLKRRTIDQMNHGKGWIDRTELDAIQAEIGDRIESGRML